jgi:hypothetical protein
MFTVEIVDETVARLRASGAELIGEVAQYEDIYRPCYMRGPAGIIVALAEELFLNGPPPSEKPAAPWALRRFDSHGPRPSCSLA